MVFVLTLNMAATSGIGRNSTSRKENRPGGDQQFYFYVALVPTRLVPPAALRRAENLAHDLRTAARSLSS